MAGGQESWPKGLELQVFLQVGLAVLLRGQPAPSDFPLAVDLCDSRWQLERGVTQSCHDPMWFELNSVLPPSKRKRLSSPQEKRKREAAVQEHELWAPHQDQVQQILSLWMWPVLPTPGLRP